MAYTEISTKNTTLVKPLSAETAALVKNVRETQLEDIPKETVNLEKELVIDCIGCMLGGANDTGNGELMNVLQAMGGAPEATVVGYDVKLPSPNAALMNAVTGRSFDFGPVETRVDGQKNVQSTKKGDIIPAHLSEPMIPAGLAVAEQKHLSGRELLTSLIVGEDMIARMKAAVGHRLTTAYGLGAAATSARLWGLDDRQTLDALGIAVHHASGVGESIADNTHCFKLNLGLAAQQGIFSARLASQGFRSITDPICGGDGSYFNTFDKDFDPSILVKDLGKKYYTTMTFKPFPCCRANHSAIQAALNIQNEAHLKPEEIESVNIIHHDFNVVYVDQPWPMNPNGVPHVNAIFSLRYSVANALLRGYPVPQHYTEAAILAPEIEEMNKKITLSEKNFVGETMNTCEVVVRTTDGREFKSHVAEAFGNEFADPMPTEVKRQKYRTNAAFNGKVAISKTEEALSMLEHLEDVKDVSEIMKLLVP